jgi:multiple sugar transport system substrate-binding protein
MRGKVFRTVLGLGLLTCILVLCGGGVAFGKSQVTIQCGNWQWLEPGRAEVLEGFIEAFEKEYPSIKVEKLAIPYSSYTDGLATQFEAGMGPDIFFIQGKSLIPWIARQYLAPLDELIDLKAYADEFSSQQEVAVRDGQTYAVLYEGFTYAGLIYNKELLDKAGVKVPTTPQELLEASEAIYKATGKIGLIYPTSTSSLGYLSWGARMITYGFGGMVVKDGEFAVNQPEFIQGVEFLKQIYDCKSHPAGMDFGLQRQLFLEGEAAMCIDGCYWPSTVRMNNPELYEVTGVAPLPFPEPYRQIETNWYALNANSSKEKKEAAAEFLKFLMRPEIASKWAFESGIPGLNSTYKAVSEALPWFKVYEDAFEWGVPEAHPGYEEKTNEINDMIANQVVVVLSGRMTAKEAMDQLKKDLDKRFAVK